MNKQWNPKKQTVELERAAPKGARPSRIRREPARADNALSRKLDKIDWRSPEWERRVILIGVTLFALAFFIITVGISEISSH